MDPITDFVKILELKPYGKSMIDNNSFSAEIFFRF